MDGSRARTTVLIVDDNDDIRDVYAAVLEGEGYAIRVARDGVEALAVLEREADRIALVVLDLRMPRLDGFALLDRMDADPALAAIPVIVTSATGTAAQLTLHATVCGLLAKPVDMAALVDAVAAAAGGSAGGGAGRRA